MGDTSDTGTSLSADLAELSAKLQQEHLYVTTEKESLQRLFHSVTLLSERVFHTAWIARQQKINLQNFIDKGNNPETASEVSAASLIAWGTRECGAQA